MARLRTFINIMMALLMIALAIVTLLWQKVSFSSEIFFSVSLSFSIVGGVFLALNSSNAPTNVFRILYGFGALSLLIISILMIVFFLSQGIPWLIFGIIFGSFALVSLAISYFGS